MNKANPKITHCEFTYRCPKTWDQLFKTNVDSVRFCDQCDRNVYLSNSSAEALEHASRGECVAIPIELTNASRRNLDRRSIVVGEVGPLPYNKPRPLPRKKENIEDLYVRSVDHPAEFYGIDGCPTGWFYVGIDIKGECQFGVLEKYSDIGLFARRAKLTLVDIPIGLLSSGQTGRLCDSAARKVIKPRGSCVFPAPARAALLEHSYITGSEANRLPSARACYEDALNTYKRKDVAADDILDALVGAVTLFEKPCDSDIGRSCASMRPRHTVHPEHNGDGLRFGLRRHKFGY